jgi:hypothetical protein
VWQFGDAAEDANSGEGPTDYTGTNNQEAGVDELDNVKTNGTHLFVAQNKAFHILKSWPAAETEQVAKIELPGWTYGMFLVDDHTAVVLSSLSPQEAGLPADAWWSGTRAHVIDITDPAAPVVTRTEDAEGWLTSARMIDGQITLVLNQYIQFDWAVWEEVYAESALHTAPAWDAPEEDWTAYEAELRNSSLRDEAGESAFAAKQAELAAQAGISKRTLERMEAGGPTDGA